MSRVNALSSPPPPYSGVPKFQGKEGLPLLILAFAEILEGQNPILWSSLLLEIQAFLLPYFRMSFHNSSKHPTFSCLAESRVSFPVNNLDEILPENIS